MTLLDLDPTRAARNRRYYAAHKHARRIASGKPARRFIGVDGEGGGVDDLGRQNYLLMRAGDAELFRDNARLSTEDCLEFLLSLPKEATLVGYFFSYDATQILRDVPAERISRLFEKREMREGISPYTFWRGYAIDFRPRQYFRVARADRNTMRVIPGSARTVNEVGGFFQKSFVEAIREWNVGDKQTVDMIAEQKERRAEFTLMTQAERDYCGAECEMLKDVMKELEQVCEINDIVPSAWRGAGWLSAKLHTKYGTPKRSTFEHLRPKALTAHAIRAYYGGRFEITTVGKVDGTVYEYDINSAYPAAMLKLPCPLHTKWKRFHSSPPSDGRIFVARCSFAHGPETLLAGLPVRRKGRLFWPITGEGTYWGCELDAAIGAGTQITKWKGGYYAEADCDCKSHAWVDELYQLRKSIGKATRGYPIKLGLNGLYGKYAQREGAAPWRDYIAAGIITAETRAKLVRAYTGNQDAILYLATDALFSRRPLHVAQGEGLGEWEVKERDGLFIVQPGIYWSSDRTERPKTRGIPRSQVIAARDQFEASWADWLDASHKSAEAFRLFSELPERPLLPAVTVPVTSFIGHRMALAWGRPEAAGSWIVLGNGGRRISFDWKEKRDPVSYIIDGMSVRTMPREGGTLFVSESYDPKQITELDEQAMLDEAMQDFTPWGNSGE